MDDLAMASGVTPEQRADRAREALRHYPDGSGDVAERVGDLIADLLHLLDAEEVDDPAAVLATGEHHWECERYDGDD